MKNAHTMFAWACTLSILSMPVLCEEAGVKATLKHNPFAPAPFINGNASASRSNQVQDQNSGLNLRATLASRKNPLANINGELLTIGSTIQGFQVSVISEGSVTLIKEETTLILSVDERETQDD